MKKHSLAILMAMAGPKSQTSSGSGSPTTSIASPDQSGDAMAPGGDMDGEDAPEGSEMDSDASGPDADEYAVPLPKGFKVPSSAESGGYFTTTMEACVKDGKLMISKIGDMPVSSDSEMPEDESPEEEQTDTSGDGSGGEDQPSPALSGYAKKKSEDNKARSVFQPGR